MNNIIERINNILSSSDNTRGILRRGMSFSEVMDVIVSHWSKINAKNKEAISNILLDRPNYLIGNEKWVLYNYICQVPSPVGILAGNYAYYKIKNMLVDISDVENKIEYQFCKGVINGENIYLVNNNADKYKLQRNEIRIVNKMKKGNAITLYFK